MEDEEQIRKQSKEAGLKVLWAFLAFFGAIFSVNAYFAYEAISTNPGVVAENYYKIGLHYNDILEKARKLHHEQAQEHSNSGKDGQPAADK